MLRGGTQLQGKSCFCTTCSKPAAANISLSGSTITHIGQDEEVWLHKLCHLDGFNQILSFSLRTFPPSSYISLLITSFGEPELSPPHPTCPHSTTLLQIPSHNIPYHQQQPSITPLHSPHLSFSLISRPHNCPISQGLRKMILRYLRQKNTKQISLLQYFTSQIY